MTQPVQSFDFAAQRKYLERLTRRARLHMIWEQYAPLFALAALSLGLFLAGSFSGLWERIGDPWRGLSLIAVIALFIRSAWRSRAVSFPTQRDAELRVEHDAGLTHRPIAALRDSPASVQGAADAAAWQAHMAQASDTARRAKPTQLRPAIAPRDPYFLRFIIPAILGLTLMLGTSESLERLRASLIPTWQSATIAQNAKFDAWVDPPDYTGRPPVYFKGTSSVSAPAGSEFVARVTGIKNAPRLALSEGGRTRRLTPTRLGPQSFEVRAVLNNPSRARWRIGSLTQTWTMDIGVDTQPMVVFDKTPEASKRDRLVVTYSASDDYGITQLFLEIVPERQLALPPERIGLEMPGAALKDVKAQEASLSLVKHRWAGQQVRGVLVAIDGSGQEGRSAFESFAIPDKIFIDPLAKAVVENRSLILNADGEYGPEPKPQDIRYPAFTSDLPEMTIERAPKNIRRVYDLLGAITDVPDALYRDVSIFMGLRYVRQRVAQAESMSDIAGLDSELWDIALRAEFGPLGNAREEMIAAEQDLRDGIARRARKREIDTLFRRYNDAVDRYVEYLTDNAETVEGGGGGEGGGSPRDVAEIQRLMDAIEEANRLGDTAGARRALTQLAELLENMQIQKTKGGKGEGGEGDSDDGLSEEAKDALEGLADLTGEQRRLEDEARRQEEAQNRQNQPGGQSGEGRQGQNNDGEAQTPDAQQLARDQATLSGGLDKLEEELLDPKSGIEMDQAPEAKQGSNAGPGGGGPADPNETGPGAGEIDPDAPEGRLGQGLGEPDGTESAPAISPEDAIARARAAMKRAEDALARGDYAEARKAQREAIAMMRAIGIAVVAQGNNPNSEDGQQSGNSGQPGGDPFGRGDDGQDGGAIGDGLDMPAESDRQRARDLMEELRRRSAEQERDQEERDYLERLLDRF